MRTYLYSIKNNVRIIFKKQQGIKEKQVLKELIIQKFMANERIRQIETTTEGD